MRLDLDKMITVLSTIFAIVILSATGVQGVMNDKLRKKLISSPYLKHVILIISIYTTKTYEIIQLGKDDQKDFKKNMLKSVIIWVLLLFLLKMDFNYVLLVIVLVLGNKALKDTKKTNKFKNTLLKVTRYSIIAVYIFGVYQYLTKDGSRNPRSIVDSMLKTIN